MPSSVHERHPPAPVVRERRRAASSWEHSRDDAAYQEVFEAGWFIVPEAQGRGAGSAALTLLIDDARAHADGRRLLTAFPDENNAPSNALCRNTGFTLTGQRADVFRAATLMMNEWVFDLQS
ncbi:GNAT family protein [Microbacterium sp. AK031]|uniref:GNAT family N-acetyltransferase n=1 Tax=Microbacterium sp. AK031 TaxID=2723076 RepID=UPI00286EB477|nr:GNAT family protein [Microbacterium sp. AK031]